MAAATNGAFNILDFPPRMDCLSGQHCTWTGQREARRRVCRSTRGDTSAAKGGGNVIRHMLSGSIQDSALRVVNEFYKKECQEKSSPSTGGREGFVSRSSPLHCKSASRFGREGLLLSCLSFP